MASRYPQEVRDYIIANHKGVGYQAMADQLNAKFGTSYTGRQMRSFYNYHGLHAGIDTHFQEGHTPWQKGMKGYYPPGAEKSWFSAKPEGNERINKDGYPS